MADTTNKLLKAFGTSRAHRRWSKVGDEMDSEMTNGVDYSTDRDESYSADKYDDSYGTVKYKKHARVLRNLNIGAAFLHLASFIGALTVVIIFRKDSLQTQLTTDFTKYDDSLAPTVPEQAGPFDVMLESLGFYQVAWVELAFPIITSIFHFIIAFVPIVNANYTRDALINEKNWIRWLEYGITASIMNWVLFQVSGITNIFTLIVVAIIMNVVLQYLGYVMEDINTPKELAFRSGKVHWAATIIGWIVFVGQWIIVFGYFFGAVTSERPIGVDPVPAFVYVIVIGLFVQYSLFGFVQLFHYLRWPRWIATGYGAEISYIVLSFISKFFLDWTLIAGIVTNQRE